MHFFITYTSNLRAVHRSGEDRAPLVQVNGIVEAEVLVHPRDRLHLLLRQVEIHDRHFLGKLFAPLEIDLTHHSLEHSGFALPTITTHDSDSDQGKMDYTQDSVVPVISQQSGQGK